MLYYIEQIIFSELMDWYNTNEHTYEVFDRWYLTSYEKYVKMNQFG